MGINTNLLVPGPHNGTLRKFLLLPVALPE